jgi:hypothetical protein
VTQLSDDTKDFCIIPAQPGWALVEFVEGAPQSDCAACTPILAWRIETTEAEQYINKDLDTQKTGELWSEATPITVESLPGKYWLLAPSGQVISPEDQTWVGLGYWKAEMFGKRKTEEKSR